MIKNITPSFTECGKIKLGGLGEERTSQKGKRFRPPEKYDEFVVTKTYRDSNGDLIEDEELMQALDRAADGKLRAIPIVLHSDSIEEVFPTTYARYAGKKLHCSGDGEVASRRGMDQSQRPTGPAIEVKCPCSYLEDRSCKPHGTLHCSIRVEGLAVAGAIHTLRTTSIISIRRIIGSLTQIQKAVGMIQGLPLWLVVQPVVVTPDGAGTSTVYCAHIELRAADVTDAQKTALESARLRAQLMGEVSDLGQRYRAMLKAPAAADEDEDEQAAVNDEFHPETAGSTGPTEQRASRVAEIRARLQAGPKPKANDDGSDSWATVGPPPMTDEEAKSAVENAAKAPEQAPQ